jgi:hypothetical protein
MTAKALFEVASLKVVYVCLAVPFVPKLALSLWQSGKRRCNLLIVRACKLAIRIMKLRQPHLAQVPEITELNCYNR